MATVDDIGVGIDIESTRRFENARDSLFSHDEWEHAAGRTDSLAGIWSAREAAVKALSKWRLVSVRDIHLTWDSEGRPRLSVPGYEVDVTISHTAEMAVAVVLARPVRP